jgi:hypothetical protein
LLRCVAADAMLTMDNRNTAIVRRKEDIPESPDKLDAILPPMLLET